MKDNREKSFLKGTLILTVGKICTQLITFLLLPIYTNILSTKEYGIVDLFNTLVMLLTPIITLQIETAAFRDLVTNREDKRRQEEIITNSFITILISTLIYILIFLAISPFIKNEYKLYLFINVIIYVFSTWILQIARGLGDNKGYSLASFISAFFTIIFNIIFLVVINLQITGMLIGTFLGQFICVAFLFYKLKIHKYISFNLYNKKTTKSLLEYSIPLIPNVLSWWVFSVSDRVIVSGILGLEQNGILSIANKFPSLISTAYGIIHLSFSENILVHFKDKDIKDYYNKMFNMILVVFSSISIMLIAFMPIIFTLMIDTKFSNAYNLIPILVLANLFNIIVSMLGIIYNANKDTKSIANTSIIASIINVIVHFAFIKFIGVYAAVVSTFISYFVMAIYRIYTTKKRYFKIEFDITKLLYAGCILLIVILSYYLRNMILNIVSIVISIIFLLIINKGYVNFILKIVKERIGAK